MKIATSILAFVIGATFDYSTHAGQVSGVPNTQDVTIAGAPYTPVVAQATGANSVATATMPAVVGKTNYITGFEITGLGATAAGSMNCAGYLQGANVNFNYVIAIPAGVLVGITPVIVEFTVPLSSGTQNSVIQMSCPAAGAGNTLIQVVVHGYAQ